MAHRIKLTVSPEMEKAVEALQEHVAPDDIYLFTLFMIEQMSDIVDTLYNIDSETYTAICMEDEKNLLFMNLLASYEKFLER